MSSVSKNIKEHCLIAYKNLDLKNLPGEAWKEVTDYEEFYQVSNYGRVKSLPRYHETFIYKQQRTISYWTKERIKRCHVKKSWNTVVNKPYFECAVTLNRDRTEKRVPVRRLVYHAFVKPIHLEKDQLLIMNKDGNGLNNHYQNLIAGLRTDVLKRSYDRKRHISPFALKSKEEMKQLRQKGVLKWQKSVIQYSLTGERIKVFPSIKEASLKTGIADPNLVRVLKGDALTAGGFIWRYFPDKKKINTSHILKRKADLKTKNQKAVKQYSSLGNLLNSFKSIKEAADHINLTSSVISNCLAGRIKQAGGFKWKWA